MAQDADDEGISTVNTNVRIVTQHRLESYETHDRIVIMKGFEEPRDLIVMINRINDEHGSVTGVSSVTDDVVIVYCNNF